MVGHTGVLQAAITACETVDACVGRVLGAVDLSRYAVIVTADHGNCETMIDPATGGPHTAHTTNPVPHPGGTRNGARSSTADRSAISRRPF
jgi:2,3-bisphosphoglycerate-independent phosphoglycerate mutase